jgi:hypothetical protein
MAELGEAEMEGEQIETLLLRRGKSRNFFKWKDEDFDVFDGRRRVGRIFLVERFDSHERWFWGVRFAVTGCRSFGERAVSLEDAKAQFEAEYQKWNANMHRRRHNLNEAR